MPVLPSRHAQASALALAAALLWGLVEFAALLRARCAAVWRQRG